MKMKELLIVVMIIMFCLGLVFMGVTIHDTGYKNGQIDALTGKVKYELVEYPNKTKSWVEIKKK